eukprot:708666-Amphidinium_carterae.1
MSGRLQDTIPTESMRYFWMLPSISSPLPNVTNKGVPNNNLWSNNSYKVWGGWMCARGVKVQASQRTCALDKYLSNVETAKKSVSGCSPVR